MNVVEQIRQAERALYAAQRKDNVAPTDVAATDAGTLGALLADELVFVGPDGGLYTKLMDLEAHRTGAVQITTLVPHEPTIVLLSDHVAIASVQVELAGFFAGQRSAGLFRYLRVWAWRQGRWQIVAGSCTPVT